MSMFGTVAAILTYLGLSITAIFALIRVVRGPSILDRMIASDVLLTTIMIAVGADMVFRGHTHSIALMTVIAATSVFATITVARYVRRRTEATLKPVASPEAGDTSA